MQVLFLPLPQQPRKCPSSQMVTYLSVGPQVLLFISRVAFGLTPLVALFEWFGFARISLYEASGHHFRSLDGFVLY